MSGSRYTLSIFRGRETRVSASYKNVVRKPKPSAWQVQEAITIDHALPHSSIDFCGNCAAALRAADNLTMIGANDNFQR
jgi:hypothetical protein